MHKISLIQYYLLASIATVINLRILGDIFAGAYVKAVQLNCYLFNLMLS